MRPAARPRRLAAAFDLLIDGVATNPAADPILLSMHAMEIRGQEWHVIKKFEIAIEIAIGIGTN